MQLDFTSDQEELRASVRAVLAKECTRAVVRSHVEHVVAGEPSDAGRGLWNTFVALDWPALTVPEAQGGIGLGAPELAVVAEELGRVLALGPLLTTMAGFVPLLREAQGGEPWLARVAAGEISGAAAHATDHVLCGDEVDLLAVVVDGGIAVVPSADVKVSPINTVDASRSLVSIADVPGTDVLPITPDGVQRAREQFTVAIAFELVGTCQTIFDTNLQYAKERFQFGVPIGSFQAVKHKLANMFVAIERARALCVFATATINEDDSRRSIATSAAKAAAGDCQRLVAQDGIQLLGGIGYTWEHDQHLFVKRCKVSDALLGNASFHRQRVADALGL
ncbi:MAG TPA: acyl-CoA dehydrogenase family protein [Acidimicrobiales bacterium]|jgi:alkylation response protein AidB-like acyl-CoA dehydrogenase|nr:acyl-CoA dehydrogenase family protein [Acidimicrobiales bacterium]